MLKKKARIHMIDLLIVCLLILMATESNGSNLFSMSAATDSGLYRLGYMNAVYKHRAEAGREGDGDGWASLWWDRSGDTLHVDSSSGNIWQELGNQPPGSGISQIIRHSRRGTSGPAGIPDPHPFNYRTEVPILR